MPDLRWVAFFSSIVIGQVISAILSGTNIFISLINRRHFLYPQTFPNEIVYHCLLIISLFALPVLVRLYQRLPTKLFIWYALLGFVDFGANVAVLMSFEKTSAISVMVITSTSAIFAMLMAMVAFGRRYGSVHLTGTIVVVAGLIFINYSKYLDDAELTNGFYWSGTVLAFIAAIGYALSNTINEYVCRFEKNYPIGALSAMGLFGSLISLIVCNALPFGRADRDAIIEAPAELHWLLAGFVACMVVFYIVVPWYIQRFSAVLFNFNILTADLIVLLFNLIFHGQKISAYYMAGFVLVIVGMVVFNVAQPIEKGADRERLVPINTIDKSTA